MPTTTVSVAVVVLMVHDTARRRALPRSPRSDIVWYPRHGGRDERRPRRRRDAAAAAPPLADRSAARRRARRSRSTCPRSTTYHLLTVLTEHGFVVHLPEERRYGLGLAAFELGSAYSRQAPLARAARPVLARLVDQVGESAHLAVLHGRDVALRRRGARRRAARRWSPTSACGCPRTSRRAGARSSRDLPPAQVRALFPGREAFVDRTGVGPRRLSELRTILTEVRRVGWASERGDVTTGFASVAVGRPRPHRAPDRRARGHVRRRRGPAPLVRATQRAAAELSRRV